MPAVFDKKATEVERKTTTTGLRTKEKKTLIDYRSQILSVKHQCELLGLLPRSTAYYQSEVPTEPDQEEIDIRMQ
jgi:hypothetical protein